MAWPCRPVAAPPSDALAGAIGQSLPAAHRDEFGAIRSGPDARSAKGLGGTGRCGRKRKAVRRSRIERCEWQEVARHDADGRRSRAREPGRPRKNSTVTFYRAAACGNSRQPRSAALKRFCESARPRAHERRTIVPAELGAVLGDLLDLRSSAKLERKEVQHLGPRGHEALEEIRLAACNVSKAEMRGGAPN